MSASRIFPARVPSQQPTLQPKRIMLPADNSNGAIDTAAWLNTLAPDSLPYVFGHSRSHMTCGLIRDRHIARGLVIDAATLHTVEL